MVSLEINTATIPKERQREFEARVAALVSEVTNNKSLLKQRCKQLQNDHESMKRKGAALIKVADKISNLHHLRDSPPKHSAVERRKRYPQWASNVVTALPLVRHRLRRVFDGELNGGRYR